MTATKDQILAAARALGYDPDTELIMSIYADPTQVIVRRIEQTEAGWALVEDVTIIDPSKVPPRQRPDGDLGLLQPPTDADG